jgi:tRNA 2-selenouridine synthase
MMRAPVLQIARSRPERIALLLNGYGDMEPDGLIAATERLRKRLGGLRTQQAIEFIRAGNLGDAIDIVLDYYDQTYSYDLEKRQAPLYTIDATGLDAHQTAALLMEKAALLISSP